MITTSIEQINQISSYTGRLLRDRFGKGPESVNVSLNKECITIHIRNFIGPVEKFLLSKEEEQAFRYTRELLMKSLLPELSAYFNNELGIRIEELYYDWGIHNASGVIVGLLAEHKHSSNHYEGMDEVHRQIIKVTGKVQKEPERIYSWWVNPKTLIIVREGILIIIEKELIGLGFEQTLRTTKRKMEKKYIEEDTNLGLVVGKEVTDIYVDWDFERDKSVITYTFS
ncbi:uncharacterized protein YbcI [Paenibacillus sp. DS2015]|uniref:DUF2294 domain-containing protein n=1 Tax=Paenibacillus sp. DS2015 TaxID=3373917 RepID=UPI003D1D5010